MFGTIVNAVAIIAGAFIGIIFNGKIPKRFSESIMKSMALGVILIGILNAINVENVILVLISLGIGTVIGEYIHIEKKLENLGKFIEKKSNKSDSSITKSFVTASLLYCVGSMAIVGSLESGLTGNHATLFAKSIVDGTTAIIFTSTIGVGVIFSAIPVFIYQGSIVLLSSFLKPLLIESVILNMSAIGGLLIIGLGLNMLDYKNIKVGNMLPAVFIPLVYQLVLSIIS
ncbi:DUF554 domain-containing protein [Clostridiaceae bacterium HSG29]|nr:DUF554 domain-containing protein [Clostridiaceae bacterium HSG29]